MYGGWPWGMMAETGESRRYTVAKHLSGPFFNFLLFPVISLLCHICCTLYFFILRQCPCLLSMAVALSTSLRSDCKSRRFDNQFYICEAMWDIDKFITCVFEVLKLSRWLTPVWGRATCQCLCKLCTVKALDVVNWWWSVKVMVTD